MSSSSIIGSAQKEVNPALYCPDDVHAASGSDIPPYVRQVLDKLGDDVRETKSGWVVSCPCVGHGEDGVDHTPSVRVTTFRDGKIGVICRVGCTTQNVWAAFGIRPEELFCPPGQTPMQQLAFTAEEVDDEVARVRDEVYRCLLSELTLSEQHRNNLRGRGLTPEAIERNEYRSILRSEFGRVAQKVYEKCGDRVYEVPGFKKGKHGPTLKADAGTLISCRNLDGLVVALKVRCDRKTNNKYSYVSSTENSCGAPIHCPLGREGKRTDVVRIGEGEYKADIATLKTDTYTVSVPGVNNWAAALDVLRRLKPVRVLVAFDFPDVKSKAPVRKQLGMFVDTLRKEGFEVGLEVWDEKYKGIDDLLAAGGETRQVWDPAEVDKFLVERPAAAVRSRPTGRLETVDLASMTPEKVHWQWPGWVPRGGFTVLDGDPGDGKTLVAVTLAAAVTTGNSVVTGGPSVGEPADVIFLSSEDSVRHTILPRLIVAGADVNRVHVPTVHDGNGPRPLTIPDDLPLLEELIVEKRVALIIFDPLFAFLSEEYDSHKDAEVRRALYPLAMLAERTQVAVVLIRHMNKRGGGSAMYRGGGSIAISAAARSALIIGRDPDDSDLRVLAPVKTNLCRRLKSLAYRIAVKECPMVDPNGDKTVGEVPYVEWAGERDLTANDVVAEPAAERRTKQDGAAEWLRDFLADGPVESNRLAEAARAAGFSGRTLARAKTTVGTVAKQKNGGWWTELPKDDPKPGPVAPVHRS